MLRFAVHCRGNCQSQCSGCSIPGDSFACRGRRAFLIVPVPVDCVHPQPEAGMALISRLHQARDSYHTNPRHSFRRTIPGSNPRVLSRHGQHHWQGPKAWVLSLNLLSVCSKSRKTYFSRVRSSAIHQKIHVSRCVETRITPCACSSQRQPFVSVGFARCDSENRNFSTMGSVNWYLLLVLGDVLLPLFQ